MRYVEFVKILEILRLFPSLLRGSNYTGRLQRLFEGINEVQIYEYVDIHVRMLVKMYSKRLSGMLQLG